MAVVLLALSSGVFLRAGAELTGPVTSEAFRSYVEKATFDLVNQYRHEHQMKPLVWDKTIAEVARGHSRDMAQDDCDFGHEGFNKRVTELRQALPGTQGAGENVFMTDDPNEVARVAVLAWLKSPHHLKNIRGDYNYSGLGVWVNEKGQIYLTQLFLNVVPLAPKPPQADPPPQVQSPIPYLAPPSTPKR